MPASVKYFKKLYAHRYPPGLEWDILQLMPRVIVAVVLALSVAPAWVRLFPPNGTAFEVAKRTTLVDFVSIATGLTVLTAIITVTIGCVLVLVMKGPAYVADAYELPDAPKPARRNRQQAHSVRRQQ